MYPAHFFEHSQWRTVVVVTATSIVLSMILADIGAYLMGFKTGWQHYVFATVIPAVITPMWASPLIRINRRLAEARAELYWLAHRDQLSGLPNRRAFFQSTREMFASGNRPLAVMMIDIDCFKAINDRYGHDAGDATICAVARAIDSVISSASTARERIIARVGGDEFAVSIAGVTPLEAEQLAERLCAAVREIDMVPGESHLSPTVSVGIAMREDGQDVDQTLKAADIAAFEAKEKGRDRWHFNGNLRTGSLAAAEASLVLTARLRTA